MSNSFEQIALDLKSLWVDAGTTDLSLIIHCPLSWRRFENDPPIIDLTGKEMLGEVHLPMDSAETRFSLSAGFITVGKTEKTAAFIPRMKAIFGRAGAALPTLFCNRLLGYCQSVKDPVGWWVALLLLLHQKRCVSEAGIPIEEVWFPKPIHRSLRAIEDCRLATDSPEIPSDLLLPDDLGGETENQLRQRTTIDEVEAAAMRHIHQLWKIDNATEWGRRIGKELGKGPVDRRTIKKTPSWKRSERRRDRTANIRERLKAHRISDQTIDGLADPKSGDIDAIISKLDEPDREKLKSDRKLQELFAEQIKDDARDHQVPDA